MRRGAEDDQIGERSKSGYLLAGWFRAKPYGLLV